MGDTTFAVESYFDNIYTIEIKKEFYDKVKNNYNGKKIHFLLGDSSIIFEDLLPTINEDSIFFLDGHWSSGDTGKGKKDCTLLEEIDCINRLFKNNAIIIIDDYRLFGKGPNDVGKMHNLQDWKDIEKEKILKILDDRVTETYHLDSESGNDDRLIIHIKKNI